jgi:two-component system, cell cycle response regulator DivK
MLVKTVVLLIDDSRFARTANTRALTRSGFEVVTTEDGQAAVEVARKNRPDVILLDLMLPNVTGVEVLRRLKADSQTHSIPIIVVSSLSQKNKSALLRAVLQTCWKKTDDLLRNDSAALVEAVHRVLKDRKGVLPE